MLSEGRVAAFYELEIVSMTLFFAFV